MMIKVTEGKAWLGMVAVVLFRGFCHKAGLRSLEWFGALVYCNNMEQSHGEVSESSGRPRDIKIYAFWLLDFVPQWLLLSHRMQMECDPTSLRNPYIV
jgi:hypothetical protein